MKYLPIYKRIGIGIQLIRWRQDCSGSMRVFMEKKINIFKTIQSIKTNKSFFNSQIPHQQKPTLYLPCPDAIKVILAQALQ